MRGGAGLYPTLITASIFILLTRTTTTKQTPAPTLTNQTVIQTGPQSVIWIVQLSDLHFSVHLPERSADFVAKVGPALHVIHPSLVFLTGDLTDGKSKDLLLMKQIEDEWIQYRHVIANVAKTSHLSEELFYDLRGNHDSFSVPEPNAYSDFYSRYSVNAKFGRTESVQTITIETEERRHLFVGVDTAMRNGVRGPTNLFGHPTDDLLRRLDDGLSQWDDRGKPVTKVALGHFPVSFTASGKKLKDVLLRRRVSAYLCGHLHTKFGRNLKRLHRESPVVVQVSMNLKTKKNCSFEVRPVEEFWEWEMGDWRKSRAMRVLAIDKGHVSFLDVDLKRSGDLLSKPLVMVTFPVDSRFMATTASFHTYECQRMVPSSHDSIRVVVFSKRGLESVTARVFDSGTGGFVVVMETPMVELRGYAAGGNVYEAKWNHKAFEDADPLRFWVQIEAVDVKGESSVSELRPFSVNGISANTLWTWKEFLVMGCQWGDLYYPLLWILICVPLLILPIPVIYKGNGIRIRALRTLCWMLNEASRLVVPYYGMIAYLLHLVLFPLFCGRVYSEREERAYMTYAGWAIRGKDGNQTQYLGSPDVMVIILPHLVFVVYPSILLIGGLAVERGLLAGSKGDGGKRWMRMGVLIGCLLVGWRHFQNCGRLMKAYEMNPILHFPVYSFAVPALVAVAAYNTRSAAIVPWQGARPHLRSILNSAGKKRSL